jgi:hypothetical protein
MVPLKTVDILNFFSWQRRIVSKWNEVWLVKKIVGIIDEIRMNVNNYKV